MYSTPLRRRCARGLLLAAAVGVMAAASGAGCAALAPQEEDPAPTAAQSPWDEAAFAEHLRFFNSEDVEGRKTGTQGYARAAAYAAEQMDAYGLQPAFGSDFRSVYQTAINYPRSVTLQIVRPDTVRFYPGVDVLPGGRSDVGGVRFEAVVAASADTAWTPARGDVVLLTAEQAGTSYLQALRKAGARAALVVGGLEPRPAASPVQGLLTVQVTPGAAAQLLDTTVTDVAALMRRGGRRALPHPARLRVAVTSEPLAGALNVVGYVVGKRPELAREAVLVCADLDAAGPFAGVRTLDPARLGTGAAALLEVARYEARLARFLTIPERTVMFALWSGARLDHAGLQAYLRVPTWPLSQIKAVIYVGLPADEVPAVEALLAPYGLPLFAVQSELEAPYADGLILMPDAALLRLARERDGAEAVAAPPVRVPELLQEARPVARELAEETHRLVLREAVSPKPLLPTLPDTLRPPKDAIR